MRLKFINYNITIPDDMEYIKFDDEFSCGITIKETGNRYELIHNKSCDWNRILINYNNGEWKDLPLTDTTIQLLPVFIQMEKIK